MFNRIKSVALTALLLGATSAYAASYSLTVPNSGISGYAGPYGTVNVSLDSAKTTATVTFLADPGFLFAGQGAAAVNVNATSWTLGTITGLNSNAGFTPGGYTDNGAKTEDGFGLMNQTIDSFDGYTHGATSISFTLFDALGWTNDNSVLMANTDGALAAAHIFVCASTPCNASVDALATGYAANGGSTPPPAVPEPATLALLGSGLAALPAILRRRFSRSAA